MHRYWDVFVGDRELHTVNYNPPCSESVKRKTSGCSGSSAIMVINPNTDTHLQEVDLN